MKNKKIILTLGLVLTLSACAQDANKDNAVTEETISQALDGPVEKDVVADKNEKKDSKEKEEKDDNIKTFREKFEQAMDDDINTADAISVLFDFIKYINKNYDENTSKNILTEAKKLMDDISYVLGILFKEDDDDLDSEIEDLIEQRNAARKEKDFKKADEIRDKLLSMGIVLKDTRDGVIWERSN